VGAPAAVDAVDDEIELDGVHFVHHTCMRVVGGSARGRRLQAPPGLTVRPTSDRAREAIFNSLTSLGALEGAHVVDLFAGTGALGIEALSRGAATGTFVEQDRKAVASIRANLDSLGFEGTIVPRDVMRWVAERPAHFDLAFVDPPYAFDGWPELLEGLSAGIAVLEAREPIAVTGGWRVLKVKRYGGTVVTLAQPTEKAGP
jgi:16S rRNA (guanine966-N2)-methyltransferase